MDQSTGFLETTLNHELEAFDATKKLAFIQALRANDFRLLTTCQQMGISHHTISKHRKSDKAFDEAIQDSVREYAEQLEWVSRAQALEPKATLERIFQLRALLPERYARDLKGSGLEKIEINITGDIVGLHKKGFDTVETTLVREIESAREGAAVTITHAPPHSVEVSTVAHSMGEERREK